MGNTNSTTNTDTSPTNTTANNDSKVIEESHNHQRPQQDYTFSRYTNQRRRILHQLLHNNNKNNNNHHSFQSFLSFQNNQHSSNRYRASILRRFPPSPSSSIRSSSSLPVASSSSSSNHLLTQTWKCNWPLVLRRLSTHPHEAQHIPSPQSGRTSLHLATFASRGHIACPVHVLEKMCECYPEAVLLEDALCGYTPLHYAAKFGALGESVGVLLDFAREVLIHLGRSRQRLQHYVDDNDCHEKIDCNDHDQKEDMDRGSSAKFCCWPHITIHHQKDWIVKEETIKKSPLSLACARGARKLTPAILKEWLSVRRHDLYREKIKKLRSSSLLNEQEEEKLGTIDRKEKVIDDDRISVDIGNGEDGNDEAFVELAHIIAPYTGAEPWWWYHDVEGRFMPFKNKNNNDNDDNPLKNQQQQNFNATLSTILLSNEIKSPLELLWDSFKMDDCLLKDIRDYYRNNESIKPHEEENDLFAIMTNMSIDPNDNENAFSNDAMTQKEEGPTTNTAEIKSNKSADDMDGNTTTSTSNTGSAIANDARKISIPAGWENMLLLLQEGQTQEHGTSSFLNSSTLLSLASSLLKPIPSLVEFVLTLNGNSGNGTNNAKDQHDEMGFTPLHHILYCHHLRCQCISQQDTESSNIHSQTKAKKYVTESMIVTKQLLQMILNVQPSYATVTTATPIETMSGKQEERNCCNYHCKVHSHITGSKNGKGTLPLFLALQFGLLWDDGVKELVQAYPEALGLRDERTGLYPFMIPAAITADSSPLLKEDEKDNEDGSDISNTFDYVDTIYQLLLMHPAVLLYVR